MRLPPRSPRSITDGPLLSLFRVRGGLRTLSRFSTCISHLGVLDFEHSVKGVVQNSREVLEKRVAVELLPSRAWMEECCVQSSTSQFSWR